MEWTPPYIYAGLMEDEDRREREVQERRQRQSEIFNRVVTGFSYTGVQPLESLSDFMARRSSNRGGQGCFDIDPPLSFG